ncbi:MAG TPA: hypothetical protein VMN78_06090 [Longimicrobiales bacterium]|nr:hypothetical protein [Longimicrobiales bacterium]
MSRKEIRETLGFVAVAISLVFVGLEIRQNTAVARGQARQDLAALNQEWLILQSTDSAFQHIYRKVWIDEADDVSPSEASRAQWAMRLNLRRMENVYFQYSEGLVPESALGSYGLQVSPTLAGDRFREFWVTRNERRGYDPDFVRFFEERFGIATP